MRQISDKNIIQGILEHDSRIIQNACNECFPLVERMVLNTGGDLAQAKDIFQDGWVIIYRKVKSGELQLTCQFSTYLYAVCKKLWYSEKKKKLTRMKPIEDVIDYVEENDPILSMEEDKSKQLFYRHFTQLSSDCQKILILHFNKTPIDEIQKIMNYQNSHYTMDRKYRCKKSLMQRITNDPNFKSAQNEYIKQD